MIDPEPQVIDTRPTWDWDLDPAPAKEVTALRAKADALQQALDETDAARAAAEHREHVLLDALLELSAAGPFARRRVLADLRLRGVLSPTQG